MSKVQMDLATLIAPYSATIQSLAVETQQYIHKYIPDAVEEVDSKAKMVGFTLMPGTYKGLVVAVALAKTHVSIIFSSGVALMSFDSEGLLEGSGKLARHIKIKTSKDLQNPLIETLVKKAAAQVANDITK